MVIATVLALVAGGFRIVTRPMERMIARTMRMICVMWTRYFQVSSKERVEESSCILAVGRAVVFSVMVSWKDCVFGRCDDVVVKEVVGKAIVPGKRPN